MHRDEAKEVVYAAIDEMNKLRGQTKKRSWNPEQGWHSIITDPLIEKRENLILLGKGATLKSIDLVEIAAAIEEQLENRGYTVSVTDDKAFSMSKTPFRTIGSVIVIVEQLA